MSSGMKAKGRYVLFWGLPIAALGLNIIACIMWQAAPNISDTLRLDRAFDMGAYNGIYGIATASPIILWLTNKAVRKLEILKLRRVVFTVVSMYTTIVAYLLSTTMELLHSRTLLVPSASSWLYSLGASGKWLLWFSVGVNFLCLASFLTEIALKIRCIKVWSYMMALFYLVVLIYDCAKGGMEQYVVLELMAGILFHLHIAVNLQYAAVIRANSGNVDFIWLDNMQAEGRTNTDEQVDTGLDLRMEDEKKTSTTDQSKSTIYQQAEVLSKKPYAFISYSSQNQKMADAVRLLFIEKEITCWMAPYDIPAGSKYAYVINDALENCACLVLLLSRASQESQFVEREVERAISYKKPIVPIQLEEMKLNSGFKFYLGESQIIALPDIQMDSAELNRVVNGIRQFIKI